MKRCKKEYHSNLHLFSPSPYRKDLFLASHLKNFLHPPQISAVIRDLVSGSWAPAWTNCSDPNQQKASHRITARKRQLLKGHRGGRKGLSRKETLPTRLSSAHPRDEDMKGGRGSLVHTALRGPARALGSPRPEEGGSPLGAAHGALEGRGHLWAFAFPLPSPSGLPRAQQRCPGTYKRSAPEGLHRKSGWVRGSPRLFPGRAYPTARNPFRGWFNPLREIRTSPTCWLQFWS